MILSPLAVINLAGAWAVSTGDGREFIMKLPGTLDENNIGHRDTLDPEADLLKSSDTEPEKNPLDRLLDEEGLLFHEETPEKEEHVIRTRYTRKYTYEGSVVITKTVTVKERPERRMFLEVERARSLELYIDGVPVPHFTEPTLATPHVFEVTGLMNGTHEVKLVSDNSYPGLPRESILSSNMASDDTATNWNGLLGYVRLREERDTFVSGITVRRENGALSVFLEIYAKEPGNASMKLESPVLTREYESSVVIKGEYSAFMVKGLPIRPDVLSWDEYEGNLYTFTVTLNGMEKTVRFGLRDFSSNVNGHILLNKRKIFLRGETNCASHPETSYPPMDEAAWTKIFALYKKCGVNLVRFKSHCPPEAAFSAADDAGILILPELSVGPVSVPEGPETQARPQFADESAREYYRRELTEILKCYGNHPSFVMLAFGEDLLYDEETQNFAHELMDTARRMDPTRLYNSGMNASVPGAEFDAESDFISIASFNGVPLRGALPVTDKECPEGFLNTEYPNSLHDYQEPLQKLHAVCKKPVIGFENGQFEMLPDPNEIDLFTGFLEPEGLKLLVREIEDAGLLPNWVRWMETVGRSAAENYRAEVEAALRTKELSGLILFGLQDYPGRGNAPVGMLNTHMQKKRFKESDPKRIQAVFRDMLPMLLLDRYTYEYGETLKAKIVVANYGREELRMPVTLKVKGEQVLKTIELKEKRYPTGTVTLAGTIEFPLDFGEQTDHRAIPLDLIVKIGRTENTYRIFVYPYSIPICPEQVYETDMLDQTAVETLQNGGTVFFTPPATKEYLPGSVKTLYTSNIFNSVHYPESTGTMGQYIDRDHPLFADFPTDAGTDHPWWTMAVSRAVILPRRMKTIVAELDDVRKLRPMAQLVEFRCMGGNVLLSSMGLKENMQYPEVRALLSSIYRYLESYDFSPSQEMRPEELKKLLKQR